MVPPFELRLWYPKRALQLCHADGEVAPTTVIGKGLQARDKRGWEIDADLTVIAHGAGMILNELVAL